MSKQPGPPEGKFYAVDLKIVTWMQYDVPADSPKEAKAKLLASTDRSEFNCHGVLRRDETANVVACITADRQVQDVDEE
jgi:hypothetical protein